MGDGSETARGKGRRISFSAEPAAVVVTESVPATLSPELQVSAVSTYSAAAAKGQVQMAHLQSLLEGLGIGQVSDFVQRQKVVPEGQMSLSEAEFVALAGAFEEFTQVAGVSAGASSSGCPSELTPSLYEKLKTFFSKIDVDNDGCITLDEAINFWGKNFAKVNATAMFREVDSDGDGSITFDEWISFWVNVLQHGYEPDDLEEEVEMLLEGNSWVDFNDGRSTGPDAGQ